MNRGFPNHPGQFGENSENTLDINALKTRWYSLGERHSVALSMAYLPKPGQRQPLKLNGFSERSPNLSPTVPAPL